ncbi:hypothetical protein EZV73_20955 [Acidaminobacter sp. JC074]|uniref:PucR family transcriptional regulator n=1 Tax=Acidaminobacter sp. JC074 TaxID=2530199 RepID=UPI001F0FC6ED|nr:PucR family transcriptional regulator [Acidaminobacter sp. JC074]MCH4890062.1 hypothetical protein [Acidaminobacter sp. JC074]
MSITVREALQLEYLEEFKLLTNESGFNNQVTTVGILDHEILEGLMDIFVEGEFVMTTLSAARNDVNLVFEAVKALITQGAAGLGIKSVYYSDLPDEIISYANDHHFPIFSFHPDIYIEHIIRTVFNGIKTKGIHEHLEAKLETLMTGNLNPYIVKEVSLELNSHFKDKHIAIYCHEKRFISEENIIRLIDKYHRLNDKPLGHGLFKFRKGLLILLTYEDKTNIESDFKYILDLIGLDKDSITVGKGLIKQQLMQLDESLKESYYAYQTAISQNRSSLSFDQIGIHQLLMPLMDHTWSIKFVEDKLRPILEYDDKYQSEIYQTLKLYFDYGLQTQAVADQLFQHRNTILYRVKKAKELTGPYLHDLDFYEQMSIAIKFYEASHIYHKQRH